MDRGPWQEDNLIRRWVVRYVIVVSQDDMFCDREMSGIARIPELDGGPTPMDVAWRGSPLRGRMPSID